MQQIDCTYIIADPALWQASYPEDGDRHAIQEILDQGAYEGYAHDDWFRHDALELAENAPSIEAAEAILRAAYIGPDDMGVGLEWQISY